MLWVAYWTILARARLHFFLSSSALRLCALVARRCRPLAESLATTYPTVYQQ